MVALESNVSFNVTTLPDGTTKQYTQTSFYGVWDLCYFVFFNRFLVQFDIPTLLIIFIDGISIRKRVAISFIFHWIFRNIGGISHGIIKYIVQSDFENGWRYSTGLPTLPWYLGEILLDSYPFQKAYALSTTSTLHKLTSLSGFIPLLLYKLALIIFRYAYSFTAPSRSAYFSLFNKLDAIAILVSSWNDLLNCIVIVHIGMLTPTTSKRSLISRVVTATELRIGLCTMLSILSASLLLGEACYEDSTTNSCAFTGVRKIAVDIVYGLFYLDYLVVKFYGSEVSQIKQPPPPPQRFYFLHKDDAAGIELSPISMRDRKIGVDYIDHHHHVPPLISAAKSPLGSGGGGGGGGGNSSLLFRGLQKSRGGGNSVVPISETESTASATMQNHQQQTANRTAGYSQDIVDDDGGGAESIWYHTPVSESFVRNTTATRN